MPVKKIVLISALSSLIVACATQTPAPVIGGQPVVRNTRPNLPPPVPAAPQEPAPTVETAPLKDYQPHDTPLEEVYSKLPEIKVEPLPNDIAVENGQAPADPNAPAADGAGTPAKPVQKPEAPVVSAPQPPKEVVVEQHLPMPFEPFESPTALSPAVGALMADATENSKTGELDQAVTTIERAIRIEPRNANLYYKLAVIRLKQSKPRLAEDLAKKSALLASSDKQLRKHSWLLVAKARDMRKDYDGAKEAKNKANSF